MNGKEILRYIGKTAIEISGVGRGFRAYKGEKMNIQEGVSAVGAPAAVSSAALFAY